jgi:hypothetical protein
MLAILGYCFSIWLKLGKPRETSIPRVQKGTWNLLNTESLNNADNKKIKNSAICHMSTYICVCVCVCLITYIVFYTILMFYYLTWYTNVKFYMKDLYLYSLLFREMLKLFD